MKNLFPFIFSILIICFSCKNDDSDDIQSPEESLTIFVKVLDENNQPISNAKIINGSNEFTTNSSGIAEISNPFESYGKYRFSVTKDGHFPGSLNVDPYNINPDGHSVILLASASTGTVPSTGGTVSGSGWIFSSTGGFVYENGSPVTGNVEIAIRYINPENLEGIQAAFPGGDFGGVSGGTDIQLYVYGFVAVGYTQNGIRVYPEPGSVSITVQVPGVYANATQDGGKVYYYDETAQIWEESANPTVSGLDVTMVLPSESTFSCFGKGYPVFSARYQKSVCDPGDGFLYGVAVEFHTEMSPELLGVTYSGFVYGGNGTWWNEFESYPIIGYDPFPHFNFTDSEIENYNNNVGIESFGGLAGYDYGIKVHSIRIPKTEPNLILVSEISDVVIAEYSSLPAGITYLGLINKFCTGEIQNPHDGSNPNQNEGQFTFNGFTYSGSTVVSASPFCSTGIQVGIMGENTQNELLTFIITNMPQQNSGTYNFSEFSNDNGCNLVAVISLQSGYYASLIGTLQKTGAKSFTFNCILKNVSNHSDQISISGSGIYP